MELPVEQWDFLGVLRDTPARMLVFDDSEIVTQTVVYSDNVNLLAHNQ